MKSPIALFATCLMLLFTHCNKDGTSGSKRYTGTFTFVGCTTIAIDIDGKPGTGNGVQWTDREGNNHANAVSVKNFCYISGLHLQSGDKISFTETSSDVTNTPSCVTVLCAMQGPNSNVFVNDVKKEN
ncbi:hypothetical protein ABZR88_20100 [Mucilaginibacter yixingensis]|nr:hypothetical protein [Mucilaginibacter yixingensis]